MPDQEKTRARLVIDERPTHSVLEKNYSLLSLSFKDRELENAFRADYFQKSLIRIRLSILFSVFLYGMFGLLDEYIIPEVKQQAWIIRYVIFCPLTIGVFLLSYLKSFQRLLQPTLIILGFIAGTGITAMIALAQHPGSDLYYAGLLLCTMFYFLFVGLRFISATILSWAIFVIYEITAIWIKGISAPILINNSFFFIAFNITGMWACYSIERYMRSDFIQRRTILEQSDKLSMIFDNSPVGILHFNHEGEITDCNLSLEAIVGSSREKIIGLNIITDLNDARVITAVKQALSGQMSHCEGKYVSVTANKTTVGKSDFAPIITPDGTVVGGVGIVEDITERQKAEEALIDSEQRYKSLYSMMRLMCDNVPDLIWAKDLDRRFLFVNRAVCEKLLLARDTTEPLGKGDMFFVQRERDAHSDDLNWHTFGEICVDSDAVVMGTRKSQRFDEFGNVKGQFLYLDVYKAPFINEQGEMIGTVGCGRDVTETRNLRTQLMQAQKMEAIGTLAGGIAHDFNNLLQVVLGFSELMIANPALPDQFKPSIKSINKAALSGADLVSHLLTFARKNENRPTRLNLNDKITQVIELLGQTIPKMIQIELKLSKNPTFVNADASQIEQIIMNLVVNAGHAMPEGGNLVIETQTVSLDRAYCLDQGEATPGLYVLLSVSDTGHGIDHKTMERIFEPFFTTKSPGRGTGLGLAMVYSIVKQNNGHITCDSQPGAGTKFKVYFPATVSEFKSEKPMDLVVSMA